MKISRHKPVSNESRRMANKNTPRQNVYSYYKSNPSAKPVQKPERSIDLSSMGRNLRLLPAVIAVLVIIGSILISLTINTMPTVETLQDQASPYRPLNDYAETTSRILDESIGNKTKLTIQPDKIESQLLDEYPELKAAVLRLPVLGRKPTLVLDIRQPAMLLTANSASFILDDSGVAVSEARSLSAEARNSLPVIRDQSGLDVKTGGQAVTTNTISFIKNVVAQLKAKELKISRLTLPASANELDISIEGVDYFVKTDTSGNARLQVGSFLAVKQRLEGEGISPKEYIDVRVDEKVFYK